MDVFQRSSVAITIPAGQSVDQVAVALQSSYCGDSSKCSVQPASASRRRLQTEEAFIISEALAASSTESISSLLAPPVINTTELSQLLQLDKNQLQVHAQPDLL